MNQDDANQEFPRPKTVVENDAIRIVMQSVHAERKKIGLVPTMGALHEGHLSLVRQSVRDCHVTVVTVFVNPTQFSPDEDFDCYPRALETDLDLLARENVDLVFAPSVEQIYPKGFSTYIQPPDVAKPLEGECRPDHFRGVATVVHKLFNLSAANVAYFGQKDYQQALVIRHMVRDLNLPTKICVCPIVREPDGLAMSSRNQYLSPPQRQKARALWQALEAAAELVQSGQRDATLVRDAMRQTLIAAEVDRIDYVALADPETLVPVTEVKPGTVALIAAHVGQTRLIDNRLLE